MPDANVVADSLVVDPSNPLLADKLPIGHKTIHVVVTNDVNELLNEEFTFLPIGIAPLGRSLKIKGKAILWYVMTSMRMLMLTSPDFQLVRSKDRVTFPWAGKSLKIILAMGSRLNAYLAKNLRSLRMLEFRSTLVGIVAANLWRLMVWTTQRALMT